MTDKEWFELYRELGRLDELPFGLACVTRDGRKFKRATVEAKLDSRERWNEWRKTMPPIRWHRQYRASSIWAPGFICKLPGLKKRGFDFSFYDLTGCDFTAGDFERAKFRQTRFQGTGPHKTFERTASFAGSKFRKAEFEGVSLDFVDLSSCDLTRCFLNGARLHSTDLSGAILREAFLGCSIDDAVLTGTDFTDAQCLKTSFVNSDLSTAQGLATIKFQDHCTLDHRTLLRSGPLPAAFYRGCGLPEQFVEYLPSLVSAAMTFESYFLSHSSQDSIFAKRLYDELQERRVACFYAPRDLRIGDFTRDRIDQAIHLNERVLLVLSAASIGSQWVEHEVEAAFERERVEKRAILCPLMIDDAVMKTKKAWAANLRRVRHISDFRDWKVGGFHRATTKLFDDLSALASGTGST